MERILRAARQYPMVAWTLIAGAVVLGLLAMGLPAPAQWTATGYVAVIVVLTAVDMVRDVMRGHWGLDILAVMAMIATLAVGEYLASLIIVLMLSGGEALEDFAAGRARHELTALLDRSPRRAHRLSGETVEEIDVDELRVGDLLLVRPSEVVPVDGELQDPIARLDESSLTGESLPVDHVRGDAMMSGALNGDLAVRMRATAAAADSQYQQIVSLVAGAAASKAPTVRLADRFALPFTAVSVAIAGIAWWLSGEAVRFAEVLVLATPCPLLIAAPVAFMGGMSRSAQAGVIVKGGVVLESLARLRAAAFDKTGTLSQGRPELVAMYPVEAMEEDELLHLAASAEQFSSHVLASSIMRAAAARGMEPASGSEATETATNGVRAMIAGRDVRVGKLSFIQELDPGAQFPALSFGETAVAVSVDGTFAGSLVLRDGLRPEAPSTVSTLRASGVEQIAMLTGDNAATAQSLASEAGIQEVHAQLLPQDKVRLLGQMPHPVMMVGDGVNDAPVLAAADVGVAMGARGATAASESADVVILRDDIGRVVDAVDIGRHTVRVAITAIWIGVVLSVGLMVIAAFGHIPAVAGALTQELVDLACILYALRARRGGRSSRESAGGEGVR